MAQFIGIEFNLGLTKDLVLFFSYKFQHLTKSIQPTFINQIGLGNVGSFYLAYYLDHIRDSQAVLLAHEDRKEKMLFKVHYKYPNSGRASCLLSNITIAFVTLH